ncbi:phosphoribosyltransferase family protein [Amycolatopsis cynarae]|uniref:Phosphoribosyltransferase family protein n=1 Tax=Amycolatopsis cynarae TaxID=2995223 RepID=A0ABY7B9B4_9PSEU|nr:phosphoribosyltransferase family protein [Amycolatopsis sp. HUAS 11-8]WAL68944.1 phosphoribosyltransferase family protein [Amycolatopsis sp. HUAS 11-8]
MVLVDRTSAGQALAARLAFLQEAHPVVLGLPRGGVVVASAIAETLQAPLDVLLVRKISVPGHDELALGAIGEGAVVVGNPEVMRHAQPSPATFERALETARAGLARRAALYRPARRAQPVARRTAVLVDDGIATGATMRAAIRVLHARGAARILVAAPVAAEPALATLTGLADQIVVLEIVKRLPSIGRCYQDFPPVCDADVLGLLRDAALSTPAGG